MTEEEKVVELTFEEAIELAEEKEKGTWDKKVEVKDLGFSTNGTLSINVGSDHYGLTNKAIGQCATAAGVPAPYIKTLMAGDEGDKAIAVRDLNNGLRHVSGDKLLRFRDQDCRAILSDKYACISNTDSLKMLSRTMPGATLMHWRFDGDDLRFKSVISKDVSGDPGHVFLGDPHKDEYSGGVACGNSEIGGRALGAAPFIFISICTNGVIFGKISGDAFRRIHTGKVDIQMLTTDIRGKITKMQTGLLEATNRMVSLKDVGMEAGHVAPLLLDARRDWSLTYPETAGWYDQWNRYEHQSSNDRTTVYNVFQGLTRYSQIAGDTNADRQEELEVLAGKMLNGKSRAANDIWTDRLNRCKDHRYEESELLKVTG